MLTTNTAYLEAFKTPARQITGKVTYFLADGSPIDFTPDGQLVKFSIERTPLSGKLFGFAVTQKITIETLGIHELEKGTKMVPFLGIVDEETSVRLPNFYVDNVEINKVNKTTKITGYDIIGTSKVTFEEAKDSISLTSTSIGDYAIAYCDAIGATLNGVEGYTVLGINWQPNFNGYELPQTVLAHIAETTGTVCYVTSGDGIYFRKLTPTVVDVLTPSDYFEFSSGKTIELNEIAYGNSLGDNTVINNGDVTEGHEPFAQVLLENAFLYQWEYNWRDKMEDVLGFIGEQVFGLYNTAYNLTWRGCPAYEIGDYIEIQETDGTSKFVYYLGETLEYSGGLRAVSAWETTESERVDAAPATVSKLITQTYAKVDKANQEITLLASKVDENTEEMASLRVTTDSIQAQVSDLDSSVSAQLNPDNLSILVSGNVDSVHTQTGFVFDASGLSISSAMAKTSTNINTDGMKILNPQQMELLNINSNGVTSLNLTAEQYLRIGGRSRFQNYTNTAGDERTGCFWIG